MPTDFVRWIASLRSGATAICDMGRPPHAFTPSFWRLLRLFPPIIVRLNARVSKGGKHRRAISHEEIAIITGIPLSRIIAISESFSWGNIKIGEAEQFCAACRFDPTSAKDRKIMTDYLRLCQKHHPTRPPRFLTISPQWQTQFLPLISRLGSYHPLSSDSASLASRAMSSAA